jgi:hypothetical protein
MLWRVTEPVFRISSHCSHTNCVAVAALADGSIVVRRAGIESGPELRFSADEWDAFLAGARDGEFDRSTLESI